MPVTGWKSPSANNQKVNNGNAWTDPSNAHLDDGNFASVVVFSGAADVWHFSGFGFDSDVPTTATIDGVEFRFSHAPGFGTVTSTVWIDTDTVSGGESTSDAVAVTGLQDDTFFGPTDTGGLALTAADVRSSGFGASVQPSGSSFQYVVRFIEARIHYTEASSGPQTITGAAHDDSDSFGSGVVSGGGAPAASVDIGQWTGGTTSLLPGTTWSPPNGLFPTEARNDNSAYTFNSATSTATLASSGLPDGYLIEAAFEFEDTSNGRHNPQGRFILASGTGNFVSGASSGYNRDTSEDRSYVRVWAFVDNPSAAAQIQFQWRRDTDAPTGGTVRSEYQVIPVWYANHGIYSSASTACPGGTTPSQLTGFSVVSESDTAAIEISSNTVTLKTNNKTYLALGSQYWQGIGSSRTQRWHGFRIDGTKDDTAKAYSYGRNSANADIGEMFTTLVQTAGASRTIDQFVYRGDALGSFPQTGADVNGNTTGSNPAHAMVILELHDNAEVFRGHSDTQQSLSSAGSRVDINVAETVDFNDSASFSKSSNTEFEAAQAMNLLMGGNISGGYASTSTARFTGYAEVTINGTGQQYSFAGDYGRGNQGTQDTWGWSANLLGSFSVANTDTIGVDAGKITGGEGGTVAALAGHVGVWGLNLDTLAPAASGGDTITGSAHVDPDSFGGGTVTPGPVLIDGSAHTDGDSFGSGAVQPGPANIDGAPHTDPDSFGDGSVSVGPATIGGSGFADPDIFPSGAISTGPVSISGSVFTDGYSFGSGQIAPGTVTVTGSLHVDADSFAGGVLSTGPVTIGGSAHDDADSFGSGTVSQGSAPSQSITGAAFDDPEAFGSGAVNVGAVAIIGTVHVDPDTFGAGDIQPGGVSIDGAAHDDPDSFGSGSVQTGGVTIIGTLYADPDTFGAGTITQGGPPPQNVVGTAFDDPDVIGSGEVTTGPVNIDGSGHVDPDEFGDGTVAQGAAPPQAISGAAHDDPDSFGAGEVSPGAVDVTGGAHSDPDAFGSGSISQGAPPAQNIDGAAFTDADAFGSGVIGLGSVSIGGGNHVDLDTFGAGMIEVGQVVITGASLDDPDQFGDGVITPGQVVIAGSLFVDADAFGSGVLLSENSSRGRFAFPSESRNRGALLNGSNTGEVIRARNTGTILSAPNQGKVLNPRNSGKLI